MAAASDAIGAVCRLFAHARTAVAPNSRVASSSVWTGARMAVQGLALGSILFGARPAAVADPLAKIVQEEHLGVATCATSQCHGKSQAENERNVQLNEYTMWADSDRHSIAYRTLESEESLTMARKARHR